MSEILDNPERARSLRRRLNDHSVDVALLAAEAATVFEAAHMPVHVRWLGFELGGYSSAEAGSLHQVLGLPSGDRLVVHVKSYRIHEGRTGQGASFRHFFVEPVEKLVGAQRVVTAFGNRALHDGRVRVDFPSGSYGGGAIGATFAPDVFDRILLGLRAVLHLQLASVAA